MLGRDVVAVGGRPPGLWRRPSTSFRPQSGQFRRHLDAEPGSNLAHGESRSSCRRSSRRSPSPSARATGHGPRGAPLSRAGVVAICAVPRRSSYGGDEVLDFDLLQVAALGVHAAGVDAAGGRRGLADADEDPLVNGMRSSLPARMHSKARAGSFVGIPGGHQVIAHASSMGP